MYGRVFVCFPQKLEVKMRLGKAGSRTGRNSGNGTGNEKEVSPSHRASPTTSPRGTINGRGFMKQEASTSCKHLTIWRLHRDKLNHCRSDKRAYPAVPSICAGRSCGHIHGRDDVVCMAADPHIASYLEIWELHGHDWYYLHIGERARRFP